MYAAHAKKQREDSSHSQLQDCLQLISRAKSDNDRFTALLEVTHHVWAGNFTNTDQRGAVQAADLQFLTNILNSSSTPGNSSSLYKSIVLSVLAALSIDSSVITFPEAKGFMCLVNDVLSANQQHDIKSDQLHKTMCCACEKIVYNVSKHNGGGSLLVKFGTASLLLDYLYQSQNEAQLLSALASVMQQEGDSVLLGATEKLDSAISKCVDKLGQGQNLTEKIDYAKILTNILKGLSHTSVTVKTKWVMPLSLATEKLLIFKLHPDDSEAILQLVQALVATVGPSVLDPGITGSFNFLKTVVARVYVEIYMQLDGIDDENAASRHSVLDGVYKLLSSVVQCSAGLPDDADADSVIIVYRKLVDTRDTIIEFLCSVANQELKLAFNHSIVLITVRALAAMLTEITEDPTPNLLKLLPFFNLLCQPVEYSDDVIMEVKNAAQAALENIKLMNMNPITEEEEEDAENSEKEDLSHKAQGVAPTIKSELYINKTLDGNHGGPVEAFEDLRLNAEQNSSSKCESVLEKKLQTNSPVINDFSLLNGDTKLVSDNVLSWSKELQFEECSAKPSENKSSGTQKPMQHKDVILSSESLEEFRLFQENILSHPSFPKSQGNRRVSFSSKGKRASLVSTDQQNHITKHAPPWTPGPDDVLGFLLPAYMFLVDNEEALNIMVERDSFSVVVSFLQRALTQLLEGKTSEYPEVMTTNALTLVEQIHTNYPETAAQMHCFQDMFELFMLSVPNLVNLPSPPPRVCFKLIETSLIAFKLQIDGRNRNATLIRVKHSQTRFFKAVVECIRTTFQIRQHKKRSPSLIIAKHLRHLWSDIEESWSSCIIGLSHLVKSVEELQEVLVKSSFLSEIVDFLKVSQVSSIDDFPAECRIILGPVLPLIESAAGASEHVCDMVLYHGGLDIARLFHLKKLGKHLLSHSKKMNS